MSTLASEPQQGSSQARKGWERLILSQLLLGGFDRAFSLENGILGEFSEGDKVGPFSPVQLRLLHFLRGKPLPWPTLSDSLDLQHESPLLSSPICGDGAISYQGTPVT